MLQPLHIFGGTIVVSLGGTRIIGCGGVSFSLKRGALWFVVQLWHRREVALSFIKGRVIAEVDGR
jgi:hypothetical protein